MAAFLGHYGRYSGDSFLFPFLEIVLFDTISYFLDLSVPHRGRVLVMARSYVRRIAAEGNFNVVQKLQ